MCARFVVQITSSSEKSYAGELVTKASASVTATPSISAQWPVVPLPKKRSGKKGHKKGRQRSNRDGKTGTVTLYTSMHPARQRDIATNCRMN